ncbi:chromate transporter [Rhizomicrobium sp. SCGC AG-212-E05]|nr:chromate transporter [Rhizomicrobium sp. SCGC AG-212-E05]
MPQEEQVAGATRPRGSVLEVLRVFLALGLTSFGGPVAHIGYFRQEFVVRRRWTDEGTFADLVALGQFLPGPASSQVGFAIGLSRAGLWGGMAAWCGFTLPSALLLFAFAYLAASLSGVAATGAIHGLGIVAVAVVAQAVWGMAQMLTPNVRRKAIAVAAGALVLLASGAWGQIAAILFGGLAGIAFCRNLLVPPKGNISFFISRRVGLACLLLFLFLLLALPLAAPHSPALAVFEAFYRSGALVFGGGHVVLPLLHDAVVTPGWMSARDFLAGYGAAQAVPGPLFAVGAFLGAKLAFWPNGLAGAAIALAGIFLPGILIMSGVLPFWDQLRTRADAQAIMGGVNAAVVGILAAALYDPLWKNSILGWTDLALALAAFLLLTLAKMPPLYVVLGTMIAAAAVAMAA